MLTSCTSIQRAPDEHGGRSPCTRGSHRGVLRLGFPTPSPSTPRALHTAHARRIDTARHLSETDPQALGPTCATGRAGGGLLSSNIPILEVSGAEYTLAEYLANDVPLALATDDQALSRSSVARVPRAVLDHHPRYRHSMPWAQSGMHPASCRAISLRLCCHAEPFAACGRRRALGLASCPTRLPSFPLAAARPPDAVEAEGRFRAFESSVSSDGGAAGEAAAEPPGTSAAALDGAQRRTHGAPLACGTDLITSRTAAPWCRAPPAVRFRFATGCRPAARPEGDHRQAADVVGRQAAGWRVHGVPTVHGLFGCVPGPTRPPRPRHDLDATTILVRTHVTFRRRHHLALQALHARHGSSRRPRSGRLPVRWSGVCDAGDHAKARNRGLTTRRPIRFAWDAIAPRNSRLSSRVSGRRRRQEHRCRFCRAWVVIADVALRFAPRSAHTATALVFLAVPRSVHLDPRVRCPAGPALRPALTAPFLTTLTGALGDVPLPYRSGRVQRRECCRAPPRSSHVPAGRAVASLVAGPSRSPPGTGGPGGACHAQPRRPMTSSGPSPARLACAGAVGGGSSSPSAWGTAVTLYL